MITISPDSGNDGLYPDLIIMITLSLLL